MNYIDKKTHELLNELELFTQREIEEHIFEKLKMIPVETQTNIDTFLSQFSFWGRLTTIEDNTIIKVGSFLKENIEELKKFYASLSDYRSKKTFYAIVNNWYNYDLKNLDEVIEKYFPHYFDLDIIPICKNEVFVDLGAYTGDTIEEFIKTYGDESYKKIYAYEITEDSMHVLKENLHSYPRIIYAKKAVMDYVGQGSVVTHEVSTSSNRVLNEEEGDLIITTLDEDIKEKISILKMDIEGSEIYALKGSEKHLKEDHPILIISIYHGYNDFLRIWKYISSLEIHYKYYLRYYGGPIFPTEIVLYAIPV